MTVSIVIPTHERTDLLARLLGSIARQTYRDYEIIVVDDCSSNRQDYEKINNQFKSIFSQWTLIYNEHNMGAPASRNRGILLAKYPLVALVDDDDEWFPHKLQEQVNFFSKAHPSIGLVYSWAKVVDENHNEIRNMQASWEGRPLRKIFHECFIPSPTVMVRKDAIIHSGLFDTGLSSCQDWDMWLRMLLNGYHCGVVKDFLAYYHKHSGPTIGQSQKAKLGLQTFYRKHFWHLVKQHQFKHIVRYFRLKYEF